MEVFYSMIFWVVFVVGLFMLRKLHMKISLKSRFFTSLMALLGISIFWFFEYPWETKWAVILTVVVCGGGVFQQWKNLRRNLAAQ